MTDNKSSASGSALLEIARSWFAAQQSKMRADLEEVRIVQDHPTAKGDGTELAWLRVLQSRLPHRYKAEKAFVIDSTGMRSDQIDIVIHDRQYCPVLLDTSGGITVPAESVYAVLEVKQDLTKTHLDYASGKIQSVRRLNRTSAVFTHATGTAKTAPKEIIGAVLACNSGWSPPFGKAFARTLDELPADGRIDLGCSLTDGAFVVHQSESGVGEVTISTADSSLIFFFFALLEMLQGVGTVPAMDYGAYVKLLVETTSVKGSRK